MIKNITTVLFFFSAVIFFGCGEEGPSIPNNGPVTNHAPDKAQNPAPPDSAVDVEPSNLNLSWTCSDPDQGDTLRYDVYMAFSNPPDVRIAQDLLNPGFGVGLIDDSTNFYWRIVSKDNHGAVTSGNVWRFRTRY